MKHAFIEYGKLTDKLFYGEALTDEHLNDAMEQIRQFLVNARADSICDALHIGFREHTRDGKVWKARFIWLDGEHKGEELTINELCGLRLILLDDETNRKMWQI